MAIVLHPMISWTNSTLCNIIEYSNTQISQKKGTLQDIMDVPILSDTVKWSKFVEIL